MNVLASGDGWKLYQEDGKTVLELHSIYGIVEVKAKNTLESSFVHYDLFKDILRVYDDLKAQGPVEAKA